MDIQKIKNILEIIWEELRNPLRNFFLFYFVVFLLIALVIINLSPLKPQEKNLVGENPKEEILGGKPNGVLIPKIGVEAPLLIVDSIKPEDFRAPMKKGVAYYPSALPGEKGETVVLGHSAPRGWPKINYDWVFSELEKLEPGDEIFVSFENRSYRYIVGEKIFLQKGQDLPALSFDNSQSKLVLISCWPPGIDNKRIVVYSELVN